MAVLHSIGIACPRCGKPMKATPDQAAKGRLRYVCASCDDDPLHDPAAHKWVEGPLSPPAR